MNSKWLQANTKICPKCDSTIEKNGGCNHMTCRICRHDFCWLCSGDWRNHTSCNKAPDIDAKSARASLEKYLHYWNRYNAHLQSQNLETELVEACKRKALLLETVGHIENEEEKSEEGSTDGKKEGGEHDTLSEFRANGSSTETKKEDDNSSIAGNEADDDTTPTTPAGATMFTAQVSCGTTSNGKSFRYPVNTEYVL